MSGLIDVTQLPTVLAGPVVRRLTRSEVSVWIALGADTVPRLRVRKVGTSNWTQVNAVPGENHIRVGERLWLAVLTVLTVPGATLERFEAGMTYEYLVSDADNKPLDGLASWQSELALDGFDLPTFVGLPDQLADIRLAHGSCRLPHAPGPDGLAHAGRLANVGDRPHVLLLSGDQIYADDVSDVLFPLIREVSAKIVNRNESDLPNPDAIGNRQQRCEEMGLTSSEARNHLWSLGEYLAMYLVTWSGALWPADLPGLTEYLTMIPDYPSTSSEADHAYEELWAQHHGALGTYRKDLRDARRFLANVPTLMVFDDHEVTDDWNLNRAWCSHERDITGAPAGVYVDDGDSPSAPEVVANALLAYLLCQHWGNVPERFASGSGEPERTALAQLVWQSGGPRPAADPAMRDRLGLPTPTDSTTSLTLWDPDDSDRVRFHFRWGWDADDMPPIPLHVLFLDERTARHLAPDEPPQRIAPHVLEHMLPELPAAADDVLVVVVAPGPVVPLRIVEHLVQPMVALVSPETADQEAWGLNDEAYLGLLDRLAGYGRLAVLSGDVHYGYAWQAVQSGPAAADARSFLQLTCSGFHKADQLTTTLHWLGEALMQLGVVRDRTYRVYDTPQTELASSPPPGSSLPWDDIVDVASGRWARAAHESPAFLPAEVADVWGLADDAHVGTIEVHPLSEPPTMTADMDDVVARQPWSRSGWNPEQSLVAVAGLRDLLLQRHGRVLTGVSQVGFVRFAEPSTGGVDVTHTIHYALAHDLDGTTVTTARVGAL